MKTIDSYTKEELLEALDGAKSSADVIRNLGWKFGGDAYYRLRILFNRNELTLPVFSRSEAAIASNKNRITLTDKDWFVNGVLRKSSSSKKRLIAMGVAYECANELCGLPKSNMWAGKEVVLQLDHIDGNRMNNKKENLRFLCPNCHTQTETHGGRNISSKECPCGKRVTSTQTECPHLVKNCVDCLSPISSTAKTLRCKKCYLLAKTQKTEGKYPHPSLLVKEVKNSSYTAVGEKYGVSGNAIKKFIIKNGLEAPSKQFNSFSESDFLCACSNKKSPQSNKCLKCKTLESRKAKYPNDKELLETIKTNGIYKTAAELGINHASLCRYMKRRNLNY